MPTYPEWDRIALEICWEYVDYLSLHFYAGNRDDDTDSYLALARQFEDHLDVLAGTLSYVKAKLRSRHNVYLSWDEWNVWYKDQTTQGGWQEAPHLNRRGVQSGGCSGCRAVVECLSATLRRIEDGVPGATGQRHCADPHPS